MAALSGQPMALDDSGDSFKSYLVALLSCYELVPDTGVPTPRYEGPQDFQSESILRSLDRIVRRMRAAEEVVSELKGINSPLDDEKVAELGYQIVQHSEARPSIDNEREDVSVPSIANNTATAAYRLCPTCGKESISGPRLVSENTDDVFAKSAPFVVPSHLASAGSLENEPTAAVEELRLLKSQLSDVVRVCNAVSRGDLSQKITVPVEGVVMVQLKAVVNNMVDNLVLIANEAILVCKEVGCHRDSGGGNMALFDVEGLLGEMIAVVNRLSVNITNQVRAIAIVTKAVALGDLSKQIEVYAEGEVLELKNTVNGMVIRLRALSVEVARVTLEVGSQGKLGGQADVPDMEGVWLNLVQNVNRMCSSLTDQVRSVAMVKTAVAQGDLTQKIEIQAEGEMLTLKGTVNLMVDQLSAVASEIATVTALEVGTQGILERQTKVESLQGTWAVLTQNVNNMASNLTNQTRSIAEVTMAVALGDFGKRVDFDAQGEMLDMKMTFNSMVDQLSTLANEVTRVSLEVGTEGILGGEVSVPNAQGEWRALVKSVNAMAMNLTNQTRYIAEVTKAVAGGDFTIRIEADARGEMLELKETVNDTADSLRVLTDEVTRVAREVGEQGHLGWQAKVPHVGGTWKDLVDSINVMAQNLTLQVRTVAVATTAVARGDLTQKIENVALPGELMDLVNTINDMIDQLSMFAEKYKKLAREGDTENLSSQVDVRSAIGIWHEIEKMLAVGLKDVKLRCEDDEETHF